MPLTDFHSSLPPPPHGGKHIPTSTTTKEEEERTTSDVINPDRMYMTHSPQAKIQYELRSAIVELNKRGLKHSAKWCAELLIGLVENNTCESYEMNFNSLSLNASSLGKKNNTNTTTDRYQLAKTFFDLGEYLRAANTLSFTQILDRKRARVNNNTNNYRNSRLFNDTTNHHHNLKSDSNFLRQLDQVGSMDQRNISSSPLRSGYKNLFERNGTAYGVGEGVGNMESNRTLLEDMRKKFNLEETELEEFNLNQEELFLRSYSLYLAGEKYREEKLLEISNDVDKSSIINPYLEIILDELGPKYLKNELDGLNIYIYGIALRQVQRSLWKKDKNGGSNHDEETILKLNNEKFDPTNNSLLLSKSHSRNKSSKSTMESSFTQSKNHKNSSIHDSFNDNLLKKDNNKVKNFPRVKDVLTNAVVLYPWNWSAWLDLGDVLMEGDATDAKSNGVTTGGAIELNREATSRLLAEGHDYILAIFYATVNGEQHHCWEALEHIQSVQELFPTSNYLLAQTAIAHYNLRDFDKSHEIFQRLRKRDPYRLENLERFSDILYVKENKADLSQLAHEAVKVDKYRAETCCIVGNYYSLKGNHEKAIMYFQRALKLNSKFLFAWTLMGHGYLEMKNTGAAIEAYRSAVDINPRDYKAWYGLGQTYELLQMYFYALYYYRKVTMLRPYDSRMWFALGLSFEKLDRLEEAKRSYERAVVNNDREGNATSALAKLYKHEGHMDKAAKYYQLLLGNRDPNIVEGAETLEALIFLAHHSKDKGEYQKAKDLCVRLMDYPGQGQEEAKIILRGLRAIELHQNLTFPERNSDNQNEEGKLQNRRNSFGGKLKEDSRRSSGEGLGRNSFISPMPSRQLHHTPSYTRQTNIHDDEDDEDCNNNDEREADGFSDSMISDL